jgi:hypothetical protein
LQVAARGAADPSLERAALRIALRAAERTEVDAHVADAGVCHGAAGVAHVFHRLHSASGEERLAQASRRWFARALAMRAPGRGFGGFRTRAASSGGKGRWAADPGLLAGAGGVALALVAATTEEAPAWDRMLLVSTP